MIIVRLVTIWLIKLVHTSSYTRFGIPELMCIVQRRRSRANYIKGENLADTRTTSGDHQNPTLLDVFTKFWGTYKPGVFLTMEEILATTGQRVSD